MKSVMDNVIKGKLFVSVLRYVKTKVEINAWITNGRYNIWENVRETVRVSIGDNIWANVYVNIRGNVMDNVTYTLENKSFSSEQLKDAFSNVELL